MSKLRFTKMQGAGNDFVFLDGIDSTLPPLAPIARRLCDRHFGIGADQVLVLLPRSRRDTDFRMVIYDADGSEVEMCGNGIRCLYLYARTRGYTQKDEIAVETAGGVVRPRSDGPLVRVDMGEPVLAPARIPTRLAAPGGGTEGPVLRAPLEVDGARYEVSAVSMGNPHCVIVVDDPGKFPVESVGRKIETHPAFPNRTNVEFVRPEGRGTIRQRTWERGTGETLACGSGACAAAVACALNDLTDRAVEVALRGGTLRIDWDEKTNHVFMSGPAEEVFTGEIDV
jgi:diaminopimelate epimerase